eukprot:XP_001702724.1 predicted protein [Chlamydomonas reinhardtii]
MSRLANTLAARAACAPEGCRGQVASVAACIRTLVGRRDGYNQHCVHIRDGAACSVCRHQVLFVGYAYPKWQQEPQKPPKRQKMAAGQEQEQEREQEQWVITSRGLGDEVLCGVCGAWQQLWHDQQRQGLRQPGSDHAGPEPSVAVATTSGSSGSDSPDDSGGPFHRGLRLRSLVPAPGPALVRVTALHKLGRSLVTDVLLNQTLCGQQALVQPLDSQKPTVEPVAAFLRRHKEQQQRGRGASSSGKDGIGGGTNSDQGEQASAAEQDQDQNQDRDQPEVPVWAAGPTQAHPAGAADVLVELPYFQDFDTGMADAMSVLMAQPRLPDALQRPPYDRYHLLVPTAAAAAPAASSHQSRLLRLLRVLAPPNPLLQAPDVVRRSARTSCRLIIAPQALVARSTDGGGEAAAATASMRTSRRGAAGAAAAAAAAGGSGGHGAPPAEQGQQPCGQPHTRAQQRALMPRFRGGVTGMHLDPTRTCNLAMAPASMSPEERRTLVLARWVCVSPAGLARMLQAVYSLLQTEPAAAVLAKVQLCPGLLLGKGSRMLFTADGAAWLRERLLPGEVLELEQRHGEVVEVPTGWAHQVVNEHTCVKLAFDRSCLLDVAADFELLHLVREVDARLPPDAAVTATALLLDDTPRVEQTMLDALDWLLVSSN